MPSNANLFAKHTAFNYLSKMIPAAVSFIFTLLISNYLGPENYGIYNYLPAVLVGFATLFGGEFINNLLWTFTARKKSKKLFKMIFGVNLLIIVALFLGLNIFGPQMMAILNIGHRELVPLVSIFLLLTPINTLMITLFKGFSRFGKVLKAALIENIITLVLAAILIIPLQMGLAGAFIARFIAIVASLIFYYKEYRKLKFSNAKIDFGEVKKYGGWNIVASIVRNFKLQLVTIFLGLILNAAILGIYYLGQKITSIVITNISNTIFEIMWSKNSENHKNKELIGRQTSIAIKTSLLITLVLGVPFLIVSPLIINWLFPKYTELIFYIPLFLIYSIVESQGSLESIFDSINKTKNNIKINLIDLAFAFVLILPLTYFLGLMGLLIAYTLSLELKYITIIYLLKKEGIRISIIPMWKDIVMIKSILIRVKK
ncbi:MAG: oligosaccharide flippase family protein [Candidatus Diapherotrites archaeon]|nr:oligosaccharide flippase family protein [Candidatus Diapherotrites archaeon]